MTHSDDPIQACRTPIARTVHKHQRRSSVGSNSDVDEHILTNNVPSTHRHLKPVHPLSRRQCHATRRDRTQDPLNLLCKVHSMHTRALWRSTTTLSTPHRRHRDVRTTTVTSGIHCHCPDVNATRLNKVHTICCSHTASTSINDRNTFHAPSDITAPDTPTPCKPTPL